ncbi:MAG: HAD family hydrolase, partial [Theionarchaea archaeon]|nr:HAD family hydrolase [Theionarchaea archaeon]
FLTRTLQYVDGFIDHVFSATSDFREVGKSPDFFMNICQVLGISPQEMAHIGDHFQFDYVIPSQVGIHAFFLDREGKKSKIEHGVQSLREFTEKIEELKGTI